MGAQNHLSIRHILVVLAGTLILLGPCALTYNTWSVFVVPVSSTLDASPTQFSAYITVIYLVSALVAPFVGRLMEQLDLRLVLSASVIIVAIGIGLCAIWTEVWQFYISGILEGIGIVSCMFLAIPTLINRWFAKHTGFLIGLCMAMSGIGGACWSFVGGLIIASTGYQDAYLVYAVLVVVLALPATLFFIRSHPSEVGCKVFGKETIPEQAAQIAAEDRELSARSDKAVALNDDLDRTDGHERASVQERSIPAKLFFRTPTFFALAIAGGLFNALTAAGNMVPSFVYYLGDNLLAGIDPGSATLISATIASIFLIVAAAAKIALGLICDKSPLVAVLFGCSAAALGIIALLCCGWWAGLLYIGAIGVGIMYAMVDSLCPSLTRNIVGPKDYTVIYARITVFVNLAGAAGVIVFASLSEVGWSVLWITTLVTIAISLALAVFALRSSARL